MAPTTLVSLSDWMRWCLLMSARLPELPLDPATEVNTEAVITVITGRALLVFPFRLPDGASRGHRYRLRWDTGEAIRVIFKLQERTACRPVDALHSGERLTVSLRALPGRRRRGVPADLQVALRDVEVDLDAMSEAHVQHVVLMVTEARDQAIRAERIRIAVDAARAAR